MNKSLKNIIGLDIGGTKIEGKIFSSQTLYNKDQAPLEVSKKRIETNRVKGASFILDNIKKLILDLSLEAKIKVSEIDAIGIGLPGSVCPHTQLMLKGNTGVLVGLDFKKELMERLDLKSNINFSINNDANCFILAENNFGAGLKFKNEYGSPSTKNITAIGLILGTGVGGGIIINNNLLVGNNGGAAELGHTQLIHNGLSCYCGNKGCAEQYLSGSAIESSFNSRRCSKFKNILTSKEIFELEKINEPLAMAVLSQYKEDLVKLLSNLTNIFDPDYFVFGGGVSNQEYIYKDLEERISDECFLKESTPRIYQNQLGDSSGVLGSISEFLT